MCLFVFPTGLSFLQGIVQKPLGKRILVGESGTVVSLFTGAVSAGGVLEKGCRERRHVFWWLFGAERADWQLKPPVAVWCVPRYGREYVATSPTLLCMGLQLVANKTT